jgi:hypothetical protein
MTLVCIDRTTLRRNPHAGSQRRFIPGPMRMDTSGVVGCDMIEVAHLPEPEWLFTYEETPVQCTHCGGRFDARCLGSDEDGYGRWSDTICPLCRQADCCEVEYERPIDMEEGQ